MLSLQLGWGWGGLTATDLAKPGAPPPTSGGPRFPGFQDLILRSIELWAPTLQPPALRMLLLLVPALYLEATLPPVSRFEIRRSKPRPPEAVFLPHPVLPLITGHDRG